MKQLLILIALLFSFTLLGEEPPPPEEVGPDGSVAAPQQVAPKKDDEQPKPKKRKIVKKKRAIKVKTNRAVDTYQPKTEPKPEPKKKPALKRFSRQIIMKVIRRGQKRLQYCYEKELIKTPKFSTTIKVRFKIDTTGKVAVQNISGNAPETFKSCIKKHMERFKFPGGYQETTITYPFKFRSNN